MGYQSGYPDPVYTIQSPSRAPWALLVLVLGGAGYGVYWGLQERGKLMSQATAATVAAAKAETARKELEQKVTVLETEKAEVTAARDALQKNFDEKVSEIAELKGTYDKLQDKMKDEIAHGEIQLTHSGGKLRVGLVDKILFGSGAADISKRGESVLGRVGSILATIEDRQIQVSGHTDNNPISDKLKDQFPTNWELSTARATNVVRFLSEKAGVPAARLVASGHGPFDPVSSNRSSSGRSRNRRIEILLTPEIVSKKISKDKLKEAHASAEKSNGKKGTADKK